MVDLRNSEDENNLGMFARSLKGFEQTKWEVLSWENVRPHSHLELTSFLHSRSDLFLIDGEHKHSTKVELFPS